MMMMLSKQCKDKLRKLNCRFIMKLKIQNLINLVKPLKIVEEALTLRIIKNLKLKRKRKMTELSLSTPTIVSTPLTWIKTKKRVKMETRNNQFLSMKRVAQVHTHHHLILNLMRTKTSIIIMELLNMEIRIAPHMVV